MIKQFKIILLQDYLFYGLNCHFDVGREKQKLNIFTVIDKPPIFIFCRFTDRSHCPTNTSGLEAQEQRSFAWRKL